MGEQVAQSVIRFVERRASQIEGLDVTWFGGEPLANLGVVLRLSEAFVGICEAHQAVLRAVMSTNGYLLTPQLLARLFQLGTVRYQITFDGPQAVHDLRRVSSSGGPTFARIWNNLCSYRSLDIPFEILIRVHVSPDTIEPVTSFLGDLRETFSSDPRYQIMLANVCHWGGPHDSTIPVFADPGPTLDHLSELISPSNVGPRLNEYCEAANPAHLVIRPDGSVVKCAHSLDLEENQVGHLTAEGKFIYRPGTMDWWIRGIESQDARALRCPLQGLPSRSSQRLVQLGLAKKDPGSPAHC